MQFKIKGILSFPHLFQARAVNPGDDPKYSVSVLIKKTDPQLATVQAAVAQEKAAGFPSGFPDKGKCFLKDGAVEYPNDPKMHSYMIISTGAKLDSKPAVVDMNMQPVIDPSQVYAGCVAWVAVNTFTFNQPVNKGVSAGLNAVMITGEIGELGRIDNRKSASELFADVAAGAVPSIPSAPLAPPPAAPRAPAQFIMTAAANGLTREAYHAAGWTDAQLIENGFMVAPSFA